MTTMTTQHAKAEITAPEGAPTITVVRDFAAAPAQVWRAMTEPDLVAQWMGPDRLTCTVEVWDVHHGGAWRMLHTDEEGNEYAFRGVFHGEQSAERSTRTFEYEGLPGHVTLEWQGIEDLGDGTCRLTGHSTYMSVEDRDGMIESGMDVGVHEGYARLDALLAAR